VKRLMLPAVILAALVILVVPSVATGSTWRVKDRAGHNVGTIENSGGLFQGDVKHMNGSWAGWISSGDSGGGHVYSVLTGEPRTVIGGGVAWIGDGVLHPTHPSGSLKVIGKVVKTNGRWRVFKRVKGVFRRVGSVPGACTRSYAIGAGRLLLW